MLGVCGKMTEILESAFPDTYHFKPDRDYADYIYDREKLANLPGKKLQSKRNHCNKFRKLFPNYEYRPLTKEMIPACLALQKQWRVVSKNEEDGENEFTNELRSMTRVFDFWDDLDVVGGTIWVDGNLVAFTYGAPINQNTSDVCVGMPIPATMGHSQSSIRNSFAICRNNIRSLTGRKTLVLKGFAMPNCPTSLI